MNALNGQFRHCLAEHMSNLAHAFQICEPCCSQNAAAQVHDIWALSDEYMLTEAEIALIRLLHSMDQANPADAQSQTSSEDSAFCTATVNQALTPVQHTHKLQECELHPTMPNPRDLSALKLHSSEVHISSPDPSESQPVGQCPSESQTCGLLSAGVHSAQLHPPDLKLPQLPNRGSLLPCQHQDIVHAPDQLHIATDSSRDTCIELSGNGQDYRQHTSSNDRCEIQAVTIQQPTAKAPGAPSATNASHMLSEELQVPHQLAEDSAHQLCTRGTKAADSAPVNCFVCQGPTQPHLNTVKPSTNSLAEQPCSQPQTQHARHATSAQNIASSNRCSSAKCCLAQQSDRSYGSKSKAALLLHKHEADAVRNSSGVYSPKISAGRMQPVAEGRMTDAAGTQPATIPGLIVRAKQVQVCHNL